jgi:hypothetical protein
MTYKPLFKFECDYYSKDDNQILSCVLKKKTRTISLLKEDRVNQMDS